MKKVDNNNDKSAFSNWGTIFDSTTVAAAVADRFVSNSEVIVLKGKSYRNRNKKGLINKK